MITDSKYKFKKVCLVDDDDIYQFLMKKELKSTNLVGSIQNFADGSAAIEYIYENRNEPDNLPDLIFLDINMPVMNGWQFLDEYNDLSKTLSKQIGILIISSSFDEKDLKKVEHYASVSNYMVKPVERSKLLVVLNDI